ncbi:MAG TPA: hypothetical protein VFY69_08820 [Solirubrobacterales bacterium]|nr:hypothetical protein [Solirubrobacterales bacterium]
MCSISRIALFIAPAVAMVIAVLLLNWLDASPSATAVVLGVVAVAGGASFGVFADRLPASAGADQKSFRIT